MADCTTTKAVTLLRRRAAGLERRATLKEEPSYTGMNMTRRRATQAAHKAEEAQALRRLQRAYLVLAEGLEAGTLPPLLRGVVQPAVIERLTRLKPETSAGMLHLWISEHEMRALQACLPDHPLLTELSHGSKEYDWRFPLTPVQAEELHVLSLQTGALSDLPSDLQRFPKLFQGYRQLVACGLTTPSEIDEAAALLSTLIEEQTCPTETRRLKVERLERDLVGYRVQGFWPTPAPLATKLAQLAELRPGLRVLEPQAGKGDLVDALLALEPALEVEVCEQNSRLQEVLLAKDYKLIGTDSMALQGQWDRIVMNPPFEQFADIRHVRHAFDLLTPGGILVAVMGESAFFRTEALASEFRTWLGALGAEVERNAPDAFRLSTTGHSTGVQTRTVKLHKPAA